MQSKIKQILIITCTNSRSISTEYMSQCLIWTISFSKQIVHPIIWNTFKTESIIREMDFYRKKCQQVAATV